MGALVKIKEQSDILGLHHAPRQDFESGKRETGVQVPYQRRDKDFERQGSECELLGGVRPHRGLDQ